MKWNFRAKLTSMVFVLTLAAISGSAAFCLHLYRSDKMGEILEQELSNTRRAAIQIENLLELLNVVALDRITASKDIIFLFDDPCSAGGSPRLAVSRNFERQFESLELTPAVWMESLDLFQACKAISTPAADGKIAASAIILPNGPTLMVPYITVLARTVNGLTRMAALSMEGFSTSAADTLFLLEKNGKFLWAADGADYLREAMKDTGIDADYLSKLVKADARPNASEIKDTGSDGLISYARIGEGWTVASLSYKPTALQPLYYAVTQTTLLAASFLFFCLFLGKNVAKLMTRPLEELKDSADRLARGEFDRRFEITGHDEISAVKTAFNAMVDQIVNLLVETKAKAELESDLLLAQQVQQMLLPSAVIDSPHVNLYSTVKNAAQCGGDWWGYLEIPRAGSLPLYVILVGDVAGHGTASALLTAASRGSLSVLSSWIDADRRLAEDPRMILQYFNRAIYDSAKGTLAMTMFAAVIDPAAGRIVCANAGHNLPYMLEPGTGPGGLKLRAIGRPGVPLGYEPGAVFKDVDTYAWNAGTQLFLYTDGLIDCYKDDINLFDRKALIRTLKGYGKLKGKDLLGRVMSEREKIIQGLPPADDVTVVVCEARVAVKPKLAAVPASSAPAAGGVA